MCVWVMMRVCVGNVYEEEGKSNIYEEKSLDEQHFLKKSSSSSSSRSDYSAVIVLRLPVCASFNIHMYVVHVCAYVKKNVQASIVCVCVRATIGQFSLSHFGSHGLRRSSLVFLSNCLRPLLSLPQSLYRTVPWTATIRCLREKKWFYR